MEAELSDWRLFFTVKRALAWVCSGGVPACKWSNKGRSSGH